MNEIINNLFSFYRYKDLPIDLGYFYSLHSDTNKTEYWLVVKESPDELLKRQDDYFKQCKKVCDDPFMDKNISLLVLWETTGKLETIDLRKTVMSVEEDPYLFKKYVLYFSQHEADSFKKEMNGQPIGDFMSKSIISKNIFDEYKISPDTQTWQSLLYRIAIKVPFLPIALEEESVGLHSLTAKNKAALERSGFSEFDARLINIIDNTSEKKLYDTPASELLEKLKDLLEEESNGN